MGGADVGAVAKVMRVCDGCGRPRNRGEDFCTGCGRSFTDGISYPAGRRRSPLALLPVLIAVLTAAFVVGSGAAIIVLRFGHHPRTEAVQNSGESTQLTPGQDVSGPAGGGQASAGASTGPGATGSGSAGPGSSGPGSTGPGSAGQVTIGPAASQNANASSVAAFLGRYFTAINTRDYQSYSSLLSPPMRQTAAQFASGYRSTVDSAETLVSISAGPNGDLVAAVTFTSHQDPADSPDHQQSCTKWSITLFLEQTSGGYLIDQPPPGYHASYQACS